MTKPEYAAVLQGWELGEFSAAGITFPTYRRGTGPGVVVIHEMPDITPLVTKFADEVVDRGFTVVMPSLVGTPGKPPSTPWHSPRWPRCASPRSSPRWRSTRRRPSSRGCERWRAISTRTSAAPGSAPSACASAAGSRSA